MIWKDIVYRHIHNLQAYNAPPDPYKIVRISPDEITRYTLDFSKWESVCLIEGGDWDIYSNALCELPKYAAAHKRYYEDMSWEETGIYEYMLSRIESEGQVDGCANKTDVKERYKRIDGLYKSMQSEGYDSSHDSEPPPWWWLRDIDYIAVHVGRHGELIFAGSGCHRLAIADVLGIDYVPVWIRARHKQWQRIRDEVNRANSTNNLRDEVYNHLPHPDLQDAIPDYLRKNT